MKKIIINSKKIFLFSTQEIYFLLKNNTDQTEKMKMLLWRTGICEIIFLTFFLNFKLFFFSIKIKHFYIGTRLHIFCPNKTGFKYIFFISLEKERKKNNLPKGTGNCYQNIIIVNC